jgi:hypothetical protein
MSRPRPERGYRNAHSGPLVSAQVNRPSVEQQRARIEREWFHLPQEEKDRDLALDRMLDAECRGGDGE